MRSQVIQIKGLSKCTFVHWGEIMSERAFLSRLTQDINSEFMLPMKQIKRKMQEQKIMNTPSEMGKLHMIPRIINSIHPLGIGYLLMTFLIIHNGYK